MKTLGYDMEHALAALSEVSAAFVADDRRQPVRPILAPEVAAERLQIALPEAGLPIEEVISKISTLLDATPATSGPRFYNQLFAGRDPASTYADMLASLANNSMYTYKVAGPMVLVENLLLKRMAQIAGLDGAEGGFTPGGSLSNLVGLLCARSRVAPDSRQAGVDGRGLRVYTSSESHYSIRKAVSVLGVGRDNVVKVPCDPLGRMKPAALAALIDADVAAGLTPMAVNATAGTTVRGAFDRIDEIAAVTEPRGVWLHVDGAFGGSMLMSPKRRHLLSGLERADSFTWDTHKMMGVPLTCSVILCRSAGALTEALNESASYLYQGDSDQLNPGTRSLQCGRRNDALKLWAAWQYHGDQGWAERVERQIALAQHLADAVEAAPDMTLSHRPASLNVCFVVDGVSSEAICARLNERGLAMVGYGTVERQVVIRAACVNPELTLDDLDTLIADIRTVSKDLS